MAAGNHARMRLPRECRRVPICGPARRRGRADRSPERERVQAVRPRDAEPRLSGAMAHPESLRLRRANLAQAPLHDLSPGWPADRLAETDRSEEHTSELQSLMRISYAVFCLKNKNRPAINSSRMIKIMYRTLSS